LVLRDHSFGDPIVLNDDGLARCFESGQRIECGELAVARVAELSGFRSPKYLCRVLRAATGLTPRAYRAAFFGEPTKVQTVTG
jgi:AraC-like DNA-binding protein